MHPYVYKLTHKITGQYYFGFRCANKTKATDDLGVRYFTSSKTIHEIGFDQFECCVLAEFFDKIAAFEFESSLIEEHLNDPMCLNKSLHGKLCPIRKFTTLEHRQNLSKSLSGKKRKPQTEAQKESRRQYIDSMSPQERKEKFGAGGKAAQKTISKMTAEERSAKFGWTKNTIRPPAVIEKIRAKNLGKVMSEESRERMSKKKLGVKQRPEVILARAARHKGGGNPRAIPIVVNGVSYSCKKEAYETLGWSKQKLRKFLITT